MLRFDNQQACGLRYTEIARNILAKFPSVVEAQDNDGKTPLHYAAAAKDDGTLYNLLVEYGADESKLDNVSNPCMNFTIIYKNMIIVKLKFNFYYEIYRWNFVTRD